MNGFNRLTANYNSYLAEIKNKYKRAFTRKHINITPTDVLIIVDMQNDFVDYDNSNHDINAQQIEGTFGGANVSMKTGNFAVKDSKNMIIKDFLRIIDEFNNKGALIIATKDYHPKNHCSFHTNKKGLYPPHCVWGTKGARIVYPILNKLKKCNNCKIFYKGIHKNTDSYSALNYKKYNNQISPICGCNPKTKLGGCTSTWTGSFELKGVKIGTNPTKKTMKQFLKNCSKYGLYDQNKYACKMETLNKYLINQPNINTQSNIFIVGLAGDICVLDTAINASNSGYKNVYIISDLIRIAFIPHIGYVNSPIDFVNKIKNKNIKLIDSSQIKNKKRTSRKRSQKKIKTQKMHSGPLYQNAMMLLSSPSRISQVQVFEN